MKSHYIIEVEGRFTPVEVKWTEKPSVKDARHLQTFLTERPDQTSVGYVVCRCPRPARLTDQVTAIPWWML